MAFTNPHAVQSSVLATGALAGVVMHQTIFGLLDAIRQGRSDRADAQAYAAWDHALGEARHNATTMALLAKSAVVAALDAQDEAEALRLEVAQLRRGIQTRDAAIRALGH